MDRVDRADRVDWTQVVNILRVRRPGLFKLQDTDHEQRSDSRDIVAWRGQRVWVPIESLPYDNSPEVVLVRDGLLEAYRQL